MSSSSNTKRVGLLLSVILIVTTSISYASSSIQITYNEANKDKDSLVIREGLLCPYAQQIEYKRNGKIVGLINLSNPVMVAQANQKEKWGFFQFPSIEMAEDSTLIVSWSMKGDTYKMYGKRSEREMIPMISIDKGQTWTVKEKKYDMLKKRFSPELRDGSSLSVKTPACKNIFSYKKFPAPVGCSGDRIFYLMDSLPNELQGIYVNIKKKGHKAKTIHAKLNDPGLLRYAIDSLMPILWRGTIRQLADHSLVAGVYPGYYLDTPGGVAHYGVSFYRSEDDGRSWDILSRIPFKLDGIAESFGGNCFDEPAFEILEDSTFICVMRTGSKSPMYQTFSIDKGKTWSDPVPITPNGVRPRLLRLNNGVLVMTSGRPGVQIRFSFDGTGRNWSDPIEMLPFVDKKGIARLWVTCGYTNLLEANDNSFYMVYSNFTSKNANGEARKAIFFREVEVVKWNTD